MEIGEPPQSSLLNFRLWISQSLKDLETLRGDKDTIDDKVLGEKENLKKVTAKAELWLVRVKELVKDESMKKLMNKDMRVAKVMLRLMKNDLKKLIEDDVEMRDVVVKVMKDIAKRKGKAGNSREGPDVDENDKKVGQVLEKLIEETIGEFKKLMQNDEKMAVAAMHLLENDKKKLEELMEKDEEMADIIAKARKTSEDAELLSDDENVVENVNTLKEKVKKLLKPVGNLIMHEELLETLPDNVRLGIQAIDVVIGNRRGLRAELMDPDNAASHRNSCCCCVISYNYFSDRYHMSVAAKDMIDKIKAIGTKPGSEDVIRPIRRGEMERIPTNCVGLKSRNELLQKIMKALESSDVHAVGVYGMGGSGKTTLAKEVVSKAKGVFETTVMVEISESPNIEFIQDQIADQLGLSSLRHVHGVDEKATQLYTALVQRVKSKEKKEKDEKSDRRKDDNNNSILLVLDNIWKEIDDLPRIGIPRESCKLLLTSRKKDVCKAMGVLDTNNYEVGLLNDKEAKHLFEVLVKQKVTGEYEFVGNRLLKKCQRLPLAIVTTAKFLNGKELRVWEQFAKDVEKPIPCQITDLHHGTFSIFRTSYEAMASEEKKKFFLLACLSPVGSSISVDDLMRYGIGLDLFQHVNKLSEAIDLARTWAEELVSSSMLLKGDSDETLKIHDVVRESTMSFASKFGINKDRHMFLVDAIPRWICEETFNKYRGISLLAQANFAPLRGVKAASLQILLFKGNRDDDSFLDSNFFQRMTNLKVLEMRYMNFEKGLPESLCKLKVLKTLHLVECKLGDIKLIGDLGSLLVLSLRGSSLEGFPDEIGKLYKLRLLDLSKCRCKEPRIPANVIGGLSLLEGLYLVGSSFTEWAVMESTSNDTGVSTLADIEDLTKLVFLNVLEIHIRELVLPISDQFVKNLDKFQIYVREEDLDQEDCDQMPSPRALIMASKFDVSQQLKKDNCLMALLKKADFLALGSATVKNIVPELDKEGCRDLSCLVLANIDSISRICEGKAPTELFYNLCHLGVSELEKLEVLLPVNPLPLKMTTLEISDCNSLTYIFSEDDGVNKESDIIKLPCLKTLALDGVSNLISFVTESNNDDRRRPSFFSSKVALTSLEKLWLKNNVRIVKLWDKESNRHSFHNLKVLNISGCEEMESIGPPSMFLSLVQLESLTIEDCKKMQQVLSDESETQEIPKEIITFPNLKRLEIENMENLECFYGGSCKLTFSSLETLMLDCERMTKFAGHKFNDLFSQND
ncbi:disease resistance protein At4g27190-like isoform X2 [Silene latifolia]|uniref:disease resistance protein At4g27190-like isoform X2 n=1 Tax=Silene latifolia TaxID=37657 RepID=UPI003D789192